MREHLWLGRKPALVYPVASAPRTAVLIPGFAERPSSLVRVFPEGWSEEAARFAPEAIAGTEAQIDALRGVNIPSLSHALIVLEPPGNPRLTEAARERFWRAFRVPVFEQIISESRALLAMECEAHEGLHIESDGFSAGTDTVLTEPCACGRKTPRVASVEHIEWVRQVAAYAR